MAATHACEVPVSDLMTAPRWKIWGLVFAFWTLLALSYTVSSVISMISEGEAYTWIRPFTWNFTNAYLWMLLTPVVGWLGAQGGGGGWSRFWAVHAPSSIVLAGAGIAYKSWLDVAGDVLAGRLKVLMPALLCERARRVGKRS